MGGANERERTHPRARAQLLYRNVHCGLVYALAAKGLDDLTLPEEGRKDAAYILGKFVISIVMGRCEAGTGARKRGRALRVREHDV